MRVDLVAGIRKWRLIGALAFILVAITGFSTSIHAIQHVWATSSSAINTGDADVCGLCNVEAAVSTTSDITQHVVLTGIPVYACTSPNILSAPLNASFSYSLRGPPQGA